MVKSSNVESLQVTSRADDLLKEIDDYIGRIPNGNTVDSSRAIRLEEIRAKIKELEELLAEKK